MKTFYLMKKQLLAVTIAAKLLFIPQFASAQNSRIWGTYYGGTGDDVSVSVATDASGNVFLAGNTTSADNIAWKGFQDNVALDSSGGRLSNAFLVKFDAYGNRSWATYYGGSSGDVTAISVATDPSGNVYLAGYTNTCTTLASGGFQDTLGGINATVFLVKFDANGNRLWATYYGGAIGTYGASVATDAAGNVYLTGNTFDTIGIASGGFQNTYKASPHSFAGTTFLVKFDANGNRIWATYYGGTSGGWQNGRSIATDVAGNVYMSGVIGDTAGIASGGFQNTYGGNYDAFLVKFDASGNRLWATYYGGAGEDDGRSVATDFAGNVYLAGDTYSTDSIAWKGFQDTIGGLSGGFNAFLAKFDANGNRLWATYYGGTSFLGGPSNDYAFNTATDAAGNVYLTGDTYDSSGIASGGFEDSLVNLGGVTEAYLVKFDANGNRFCATYYELFDNNNTWINPGGLALDTAGNVYIGGTTQDTAGIAAGGFLNFYTPDSSGFDKEDAYLVKFTSCPGPPPVANFLSSDTTFCANQCINYTDLSTNAFAWKWSFPGGTPGSSTIQNPHGICYNAPGTFNATLIASNGGGSDTVVFTNFIKVFPSLPTPVITQHHDSLFCKTDPTYTSYQWYDSTTIIPGATDTFLVVTHGGNYNIKVTNEFGCQISVGITIASNVGINEFSANNFISLSPNRATDELLISGNWKSGTGKLTIVNLIGEIIYTEEINRQSETINCKLFPAGIYFVRVENESGVWVGRFVKE